MERKYDKKWPGANKKFMFGHQTYENIFMSCTSGVGIWTAYEASPVHEDVGKQLH